MRWYLSCILWMGKDPGPERWEGLHRHGNSISKATEWYVLGKYRQWEWPEMKLEKLQRLVHKIPRTSRICVFPCLSVISRIWCFSNCLRGTYITGNPGLLLNNTSHRSPQQVHLGETLLGWGPRSDFVSSAPVIWTLTKAWKLLL